jgi:hypothetical protein
VHSHIYRDSESGNLNLEDYNMYRAHRFIASLFFAAALVAPMSIIAAPVPQQVGVQIKLYDKAHKDSHVYDDNEKQVYTQFRVAHKSYNEDLTKETPKHQAVYWNYRHANSDKR